MIEIDLYQRIPSQKKKQKKQTKRKRTKTNKERKMLKKSIVPSSSQSFTLIELLVVIAILAALSVAVVLVIKPQEMIAQARDTRRLTDLQNINKALGILIADNYNAYLGDPNTVYTSLIDPNSTTCSSLGLPTLPPPYQYHCSTSTDIAQKVDGTGWIPVNFTQISMGLPPLSKLPLDPINNTSTGEYYTYIPGGSYHLAAYLTSSKYKLGGDKDNVSNDGGSYPELYEIGTNLKLLPVSRDPSLVGYWTFDEGSGTTAYDRSGKGNNGTLVNGPQWVDGKVGKALSFDGSGDYVNISSSSIFNITNQITFGGWVKRTSSTDYQRVVGKYYYSGSNTGSWVIQESGASDAFYCAMNIGGVWKSTQSVSGLFDIGNWHNVYCVYDGSSLSVYVDGLKSGTPASATGLIATSTHPVTIGTTSNGTNQQNFLTGYVDDVRIYNRALSDQEIKAIYEATK